MILWWRKNSTFLYVAPSFCHISGMNHLWRDYRWNKSLLVHYSFYNQHQRLLNCEGRIHHLLVFISGGCGQKGISFAVGKKKDVTFILVLFRNLSHSSKKLRIMIIDKNLKINVYHPTGQLKWKSTMIQNVSTCKVTLQCCTTLTFMLGFQCLELFLGYNVIINCF